MAVLLPPSSDPTPRSATSRTRRNRTPLQPQGLNGYAEWSTCWAGGWAAGIKVELYLPGVFGNPGLTIRVTDESTAHFHPDSREIHFGRNGSAGHYFEAWTHDGATLDDRVCVIINVAAVLFHELIHFLGMATGEGEDVYQDCALAYTTEFNFRWALYQRYRGSLNGNCCYEQKAVGLDAIFMNDGKVKFHERAINGYFRPNCWER
jgi:hypothetical protein